VPFDGNRLGVTSPTSLKMDPLLITALMMNSILQLRPQLLLQTCHSHLRHLQRSTKVPLSMPRLLTRLAHHVVHDEWQD
jgi:hypothetical protein